MILSRRVALDGVSLDELYAGIVIRGVIFSPPKENIQTVNRMGGVGQRITAEHVETMDVAVDWALDVTHRDMATRRRVYEDVCAWALGKGWLTVNFNDGRRMWVDKVVLPDAGDFRDWTKDFRITFRAYNVPYWQEDVGASTDGTSLTVRGHVQTVAGCTVTNGTGSTINSLTVTAGDSTFVFASLGLADGEQLIIDHDADGLLWVRIKDGNGVFRDAHGKRTGESSDDLYVMPGTRTVGASAGTAHFWAIGRYV